jgi:glycosyltransferase involved in cell wall biosynthesis
MPAFGDISDEVFGDCTPADRQHEWFRINGPDAPDLLEHLRTQGHAYDLVLFWTFRYAPSYFGLPLVADRSVLVPTAEEDPAIDLEVLADYFAQPAGFMFLTPEEQTLVANRMRTPLPPSAIVGIGLDPLWPASGAAAVDVPALGVRGDYLLYLGRVDRNKGCETLLDYFVSFAEAHPDATLVLAGPAKMQIPAHPRIAALGYVSDAAKDALIAGAAALVVPSPYESLSIVLLEAWNAGVPALVNGRCAVLEGQVRRANGGLSYRSAAEFDAALDYLLSRRDERASFGAQGRAYVDREYRWPVVIERVERLLREVRSARPVSPRR